MVTRIAQRVGWSHVQAEDDHHLGAGASCEIGLPSGNQLKKQIADLFATTDDNSYGLQSQTMIEAVKDRLGQRNHVYVRNQVPDYDGQIIAMRMMNMATTPS